MELGRILVHRHDFLLWGKGSTLVAHFCLGHDAFRMNFLFLMKFRFTYGLGLLFLMKFRFTYGLGLLFLMKFRFLKYVV